MEFKFAELVAHSRPGTGQKARPDAVGNLAKPEIEARRLDLVRLDLGRSVDLACTNHGADSLAGKNARAGEDAPRRLGWNRHVRRLWQALEKPVLLLSALRICGRHEGIL